MDADKARFYDFFLNKILGSNFRVDFSSVELTQQFVFDVYMYEQLKSDTAHFIDSSSTYGCIFLNVLSFSLNIHEKKMQWEVEADFTLRIKIRVRRKD